MCSVSILRPGPGHLRVVMNRDERHGRQTSRPPMRRSVAERSMVVTVDGQAGGAWIGCNAAGLVVCLLNHTPMPSVPVGGRRSRGDIVPILLAQDGPAAALVALTQLPLADFAPFTVLLATPVADHRLRWDGRVLTAVAATVIATSSSLGDDRVAAPRQLAWQEIVGEQPTPERQDAWHASRLGADPAAWVLMRRDDARTVSRSTVTMAMSRIALTEVLLDDEGRAGRSHTVHLDA